MIKENIHGNIVKVVNKPLPVDLIGDECKSEETR